MELKWALNKIPKSSSDLSGLMNMSEIEKAVLFHQSFPQYSVTPLVRENVLAQTLGLKDIFIKDESYRFGLNAFKVLGSSYAIGRWMAERAELELSELSFDMLRSKEIRHKLGELHFYTATDGNHGRAVAWAARQLGQKASILMPKGTTESRLQNILREGAECTIEDMNYDDCVRKAAQLAAADRDGILVQDTAFEGYEEIPVRIMQGYGTMAAESEKQLISYCCEKPTHIFLQAGVGSMAGAIAGYYVNHYPDAPPKIIVVEAEAADCHLRSAMLCSGETQKVDGDMETIMAGLACGEPNPISWNILRKHTTAFVSISDELCKLGMRMAARPEFGDIPVVSGESGVAGFAALVYIMLNPECAELKKEVGLNKDSSVLLFSTEGDTDPQRYKEIVEI